MNGLRTTTVLLSLTLGALALFALSTLAPTSSAQSPPPAATGAGAGGQGLIGTVTVNGSAPTGGTCAPEALPKIGVVPLITQGNEDALLQLIVHRDMDLSGQYDVIADAKVPDGPFTRNTILDLKAWRKKDAEYVLRVYANVKPVTAPQSGAAAAAPNVEVIGEVYATPPKETGPAAAVDGGADGVSLPPLVAPKPVYRTKLDTTPAQIRLTAHRLSDALLGALTGTPGAFASQIVYSGRVGQGTSREAFLIDSDGFNLHGFGPSNQTAMSPSFGPNGDVYYALSNNYGPYALVHGPSATPVPLNVHGSVMNFAWNDDHTKLAYDVFERGDSHVYVADAQGNGANMVSGNVPLAHHPAFGPGGIVAYVGGAGAQQVFVGSKPVSPATMAAAPTICDTPSGTLVIYAVGWGSNATLMASDTDGARIHALATMGGGNYPACSPDGRLIAFFSYNTAGAGPGLYVTPIAHPCNAKKISSEVGESMDWEAIPASGAR